MTLFCNPMAETRRSRYFCKALYISDYSLEFDEMKLFLSSLELIPARKLFPDYGSYNAEIF